MSISRSPLLPLQALAGLFIAIAACAYTACSNSESVGNINGNETSPTENAFNVHETADSATPASEDAQEQPPSITKYIPLDDTEYPYAGIPRIVIETENRREIKDRETEIPARLQIWGEKAPESEIMELTIRGRGNSSWGQPKKSYKIEFFEKQGIFGLPKDKDWALIANHLDTTMIRNYIANYISSISNISYTPKNRFVELFINGKYKGTYQLFETLKITKARINIGKDNFLLEVDNHPKSKDISFYVSHISNPIKIHSSSITEKSLEYKYIQKEISNIDSLLFSEDFLNQENGYKKSVDIDALVEWYVITEITKNASNVNNWYMTYEKNGKLKMGPFWDYDLAFGNTLWLTKANDISDFWMNTVPWFTRFIQDPIFTEKATTRLIYFYNQKDSVLKEIDHITQILRLSIISNNRLWNTLNCHSCSSKQILKKYDEHISKMKQWFIQRMEWLKQESFSNKKHPL